MRGSGIKWDQLEDATTKLVATALSMCVSLAPPDDGISEPDVLRRADGTSVYRVTGSSRYTSQRILFAERRVFDAAGRTVAAQLPAIFEALQAQALQAFSAAEVAQLLAFIQRIRENLQALAPALDETNVSFHEHPAP